MGLKLTRGDAERRELSETLRSPLECDDVTVRVSRSFAEPVRFESDRSLSIPPVQARLPTDTDSVADPVVDPGSPAGGS